MKRLNLKELFHRLSDIQNRELRNSKTDLHIPLLKGILGTKKLCLQGSMNMEQPYKRKQKQVNRSPPLKQN